MPLTDTFKLSIDVHVQLGSIELHVVTPVLAKTQILKFYQPHTGKQKPKTSIIAQMSAKAVDSLYAQICLKTSNLLHSYYLKIIFSAQAPVVQRLDNAIHRINRYPLNKCQQNKLRYPLDSDLSSG